MTDEEFTIPRTKKALVANILLMMAIAQGNEESANMVSGMGAILHRVMEYATGESLAGAQPNDIIKLAVEFCGLQNDVTLTPPKTSTQTVN